MDTVQRFKLVKFIGELLSKPDLFKNHASVKISDKGDGPVIGSFVLTGPMAALFREFKPNVERTLER